MKKSNAPIYVTQPALPPIKDFKKLLEVIWKNRVITNNGPFHKQFEEELAKYLGVKYVSVFSNGTLALMVAIKALNITGEVITTPFSFVATANSLWWNNIDVVFADIDSETLNLSPDKVEAAITPNTSAILPVHVYGNPCDVDKFKKIADKYCLRLIYDAAHAFNVKINGNSILNYGDLSILSFHATKVFNTIEGGAIICHNENIKKRIDYLKNFGFHGETEVVEPGINAKMNEMQAAYGLLQLKHVDNYIKQRKLISEQYKSLLNDVKGISYLNDMNGIKHNYAYFPIFVDSNSFRMSRDDLFEELKKNNIYSRRYFFPLISAFSNYCKLKSAQKKNLVTSTKMSEQVICLPIYPSLNKKTIQKICKIIIG